MSNNTYHVTRKAIDIAPRTLCGAVIPVRYPAGVCSLYTYYKFRSEFADWCPKCLGVLTPLDDLANTEL